MKTNYKILNSSVKKTFNTIEELNEYIKRKKILPQSGDPNFKIEKTTIELLEIESSTAPLSMEIGNQILKVIKRIIAEDFHKVKGEMGLFIDHLLITNTCRHSYVAGTLRNIISRHGIEHSFCSLPKKDKDDFLQKILVIFIDFIESKFETVFNDIDWVKIETNYKPCNGLGMKIKIVDMYMYIIIRQTDVVISERPLWGRNVSLRGIYPLQDLDEDLKNIL